MQPIGYSECTPSIPVSRPLRMAITPNCRGSGPLEQIPDELAVTFLEDVQRQEHAGVQHRAEREQRQQLAHPPPSLHYDLTPATAGYGSRTILPSVWPPASSR